MADFRLLFPTEYVGAHDLRGRDVPHTIKSVSIELLTMTGGAKEKKPVVQFRETWAKKLILNKTNAKIIAAQFGKDTEKWIGKKIVLYPTTTQFGPNTVDCIRVREGKATRNQPPAPELPADEDPYSVDRGEPDAATIPEPDGMDPEPDLPPHNPATGEVQPS